MNDEKLIIIVSQPRSGSTLLQALLSNNKLVSTVSEPWILLPFLSYGRYDLIDAKYSSYQASIGINDFISKIDKKQFNTDLARFLLNQYQRIITSNEKYVVDKTPRYYEILNEIIEIFPQSKLIILKRNPMSVLASIIQTWNVDSYNKLLHYKRDLLIAPKILADFSQKNIQSPNIKTITYENIITSPETTIKKLYEWLNIDFDSNYLNYSKNNKYLGIMGDKIGINSNTEVNPFSKEIWKKNLVNKKWKNFFLGYANYLTPDFLKEYGDYTNIPYKETKIFNQFLYKSNLNINEYKIPKKKLLYNIIMKKIGLWKV